MNSATCEPWPGLVARGSWRWSAFGFCIALASCGPAVDPPSSQHLVPPSANVVVEPQPEPLAAAKPEIFITAPRVVSWSARGVSFEGVAFDARSHRLVVVDQAGGPGSRFATAADAARSVDGIAAVNAGFFTPGGDPLGLVVSRGNPAGHWNAGSSLGSGVWHERADGTARIVRRGVLGAATARRLPELLQSGPMLVEGGRAVKGLHGGEARPRTLIAWDGGQRWWFGRAAPCAIPDLAAAMASGEGPVFPVRIALNLDGGRSSELWAGRSVAGGPVAHRPFWNRAVRNHLVLVRR